MSKYNKILKKRKARTIKKCINCKKIINIGDFYYSEEIEDKFLHRLHNKKFCKDCIENKQREKNILKKFLSS